MAEWVPPKIDYWNTPRPIGGEDLKRIEGNIAVLERVLIRAVPSDEVILEADTQRYVHESSGVELVKEFALKYPGTYRVKCEVRQGSGSGEGFVTVEVSGGDSGGASFTTSNWELKNFEISTGIYGSVVRVYLRVINGTGTVYIRNVKICGTFTMAEPEYAVLLD